MNQNIKCEICKKSNWQLIETYKYSRNEIKISRFRFLQKITKYIKLIKRLFIIVKPRSYIISSFYRNNYQLLRLKVLFNVWDKNSDQIFIKSQYCSFCGFVLFSPRPSKIDIEAKYKYLLGNSLDYKINHIQNKNIKITKLDFIRSKKIFDKCLPFLQKRNLKVLDYGGGKGTNLLNFKKNGAKCYLIDFDKENIKGIKNLGSSINELESNQKFDLIICSHVLEHISDLGEIISKLKMFLKEKGVIYAEVPLEIKAGISLEYDPVTHINFFTNHSLANLFLNHGFNILNSKDEILPYNNSFLHASWIIVQNSKNESYPLMKSDIKKYLLPSRIKIFNIYLGIFLTKIFWEIKIFFIKIFSK